jgi:hypothetical protein
MLSPVDILNQNRRFSVMGICKIINSLPLCRKIASQFSSSAYVRIIIFFETFEIFRTRFFEKFQKNKFTKILEFFSKKTRKSRFFFYSRCDAFNIWQSQILTLDSPETSFSLCTRVATACETWFM